MISVEFNNQLLAELPLTAENHWFFTQIRSWAVTDPTWGNQWIFHWKIMFFGGKTALNTFWTLLRPGNHPHGARKVPETIWYHWSGWDRRNPKFGKLFFFLIKKTEKNTSFCSPLSESIEGFHTRFRITKIGMFSGFCGREAAVREKYIAFCLRFSQELYLKRFLGDFGSKFEKKAANSTIKICKSQLSEIPLNWIKIRFENS